MLWSALADPETILGANKHWKIKQIDKLQHKHASLSSKRNNKNTNTGFGCKIV